MAVRRKRREEVLKELWKRRAVKEQRSRKVELMRRAGTAARKHVATIPKGKEKIEILYRYPSGQIAKREFRGRAELLEYAEKFLKDNAQKLKDMNLDVEVQAAEDVLEGFARPESYTLRREGREVINKNYNQLWTYIELLNRAIRQETLSQGMIKDLEKKRQEMEEIGQQIREKIEDEGLEYDKIRKELEEIKKGKAADGRIIHHFMEIVKRLEREKKVSERVSKRTLADLNMIMTGVDSGKHVVPVERIEALEKEIAGLVESINEMSQQPVQRVQSTASRPSASTARRQSAGGRTPSRGAAGSRAQGSSNKNKEDKLMSKIGRFFFHKAGDNPNSEDALILYKFLIVLVILLIIIIILNNIF